MKVILIEFNELSSFLMEGFLSSGSLPNFARFRRESQAFITDAEAGEETLAPWVEWVTLHSGVRREEHKIRRLGQGREYTTPRIWDVVSSGGGGVWVCGSMNACFQAPVNGHFLPDPWAFREVPFPAPLESFLGFVRTVVQDHNGESGAGEWRATTRFLTFLAGNGLSLKTVGSFFRHLFKGAIGRNRWRRALLLDRFQFDVFRHVHRRHGPEFSTFFSNSTAHLQHHYWSDAEEEVFHGRRPATPAAMKESVVYQGYRNMDSLLGEFLEMADDETALILCSGLGAQKNPADQDNVLQYRPVDSLEFLRFAGLTSVFERNMAMGAQFDVSFPSEKDAMEAKAILEVVRVSGRQALVVDLEGKSLIVNCTAGSPISADAILEAGGGACARFGDHFFLNGEAKGRHHADGLCWMRLPGLAGAVHPGKVSLTSLAPTILRLLERPIPSSMKGAPLPIANEYRFRSLPGRTGPIEA